MKDRDFLIWLHQRLEHIHNERPIVDYMHKLRAIIRDMDPDQISPNDRTGNNLEDILTQEEMLCTLQ